MTPCVSVLLTTYNRPGMLPEAVESVFMQTFGDWELIILDDDSSDSGQHELLRSYWNRDKVRIYKDHVPPGTRGEKVRYAALVNTGLKLARGEYITYLCDDDYYLPRRLEVMVSRLRRGDCDVVYGLQQMMRGDKDAGVRGNSQVLRCANGVVDHSSVMHTREAGDAAGGWDENPVNWMHADAVFWDRLTNAGYLFYPVDEITDVHRFHTGSVQASGVPS